VCATIVYQLKTVEYEMTNAITINQAATLIADIDPALSRAWLNSPFQRHNLVTAFHASLTNSHYSPMADRIAVMLRSAIDADALLT